MANPLEFMDPGRMTDAGMWVWAALITVLSTGISYGIALGWQRWKEKQRR